MSQQVIRPSSLPGFLDCSRRQAGRSFRSLIADAGFQLRDTRQHIGASVGTATHAALAHTFEHKIATGELGNAMEDEQVGLEFLTETMRNGVTWDATTPEPNTAEQQVVRMYRVFRLKVAPTLKPKAVEQALEMPTKAGNIVRGHIDLSAEGIHDYKTGTMRRMNTPQYGLYSMLSRANGVPPGTLTEHFIPRVPLKEPQPDSVAYRFDRDLAERAAAYAVRNVERMLADFEATGDPMVFPANPMSVLCSAKFCGAFGTPFCREHA